MLTYNKRSLKRVRDSISQIIPKLIHLKLYLDHCQFLKSQQDLVGIVIPQPCSQGVSLEGGRGGGKGPGNEVVYPVAMM